MVCYSHAKFCQILYNSDLSAAVITMQKKACLMSLQTHSWALTLSHDNWPLPSTPPSFSIAISCSTSSSPKLWRGSSICLRVRNVISQIFHWAEFPLNFTLSANSLLIRLISKSCRDTQIELYFPHHVKVNLVNFWKFHQSTKITKYLQFLALLHGNKFLVKENCA